MSDFIFVSPGAQFREKDLTFVTTNLGLTTLGIVGETEKGPAFEPMFIGSKTQFRTKFGSKSMEKLGSNYKYVLPYYADSYLSESSQMYVTRVLGLSGYNAGDAWAVSAIGLAGYNDMTVAILRSKATYTGNSVLNFTVSNITMSDGLTSDVNILSDFIVSVTVNSIVSTYTVSLNESSPNFISKVFGTKPKEKNTPIYVESVYPQLIKKEFDNGNLIGVNNITNVSNSSVSNYNSPYQTPQTPWVVSQLRGNSVERLFRLISISDGSGANKEIKISIQNINFENGEFDVIIRNFNDSDDNMLVLETFTRCTMNPTLNSYVSRRIGSVNGEFDIKSSYVLVEMGNNVSEDSLPCGFEGYNVRQYGSLVPTSMVYKNSYSPTDKIRKTFLGISEKAFGTSTYRGNGVNQNIFNYIGADLSTNISKTKGFHLDVDASTGIYSDGSYVIGAFVGGIDSFKSLTDQINTTNEYNSIHTRKFTLVPAGGFDGWDEHRVIRTNTESFRSGGTLEFPESDYYAYQKGIYTFNNPEQVSITLFSTPGINYFDNLSLVNDTIEMIEIERSDSLYIVDSPDIASSDGYAEELVDLLGDTGIDSNYTATYVPNIEVFDRDNNAYVFIPPTGEVLRSIAYTDNKAYPWYSPAGLDRGSINARRTKKILKKSDRDTLYKNRINALAYFPNTGVSIMGQKNLQIKDSALDRINVRRLLLELRRLISNVAVRLLFEPNDQTIIDQFLSKVNPILDNVRRERGLVGFRVAANTELNTPEAIDRNELYFKIQIQPTPTLEFIGIEFYVTPTGAVFENV